MNLISNEFYYVVENEINNLEDAENILSAAREKLFGAMKSYINNVEGALILIDFYKNRIECINKIIECLK
mgnify:CR=1 FL=1|tara:strand:- start:2262 stop:2471 length:210 start_codon:yes stop_codon:yes gene_type:complete